MKTKATKTNKQKEQKIPTANKQTKKLPEVFLQWC